MVNNIAHTREWRESADRLCADGYEMKTLRNRIVPAMFVRDGQPTLYLYCPILDEHYQIIRDGWQTVDYRSDVPVISVPYDICLPGKRAPRLWIARRMDTLPALFGVRDVAEHIGVAKQYVSELVQKKKITFSQVGKRGTIVCREEDILAWLANRRLAGRPPATSKRSAHYLGNLSKPRLLKHARSLVTQGAIQADTFVSALPAIVGNMLPPSTNGFWELVSNNLTRQNLIGLIREDTDK